MGLWREIRKETIQCKVIAFLRLGMVIGLDFGKTFGAMRPLCACSFPHFMRWPVLKVLGWLIYGLIDIVILDLEGPLLTGNWILLNNV